MKRTDETYVIDIAVLLWSYATGFASYFSEHHRLQTHFVPFETTPYGYGATFPQTGQTFFDIDAGFGKSGTMAVAFMTILL